MTTRKMCTFKNGHCVECDTLHQSGKKKIELKATDYKLCHDALNCPVLLKRLFKDYGFIKYNTNQLKFKH